MNKMNKYLDQFDENNNVRLINAIKQQNKKNFDKILPKINNLNYERWEYHSPYSPLIYTADLEDTYFAQELIKAGADVNFQNSKNKITPLMVASARGNVPFIELLIKNRVDINAETKNGSVALRSAIVNRRFDVVKLLHEHGAKLQDKDCIFDAIESGETRIVKYFINNGVNVNKRDKKGNTLIMRSLINQDHHMASNLLELNADVNTKNNQGMTPLMLLIINGYKNYIP